MKECKITLHLKGRRSDQAMCYKTACGEYIRIVKESVHVYEYCPYCGGKLNHEK